MKILPPVLRPAKECKLQLNFRPRSHWPSGLPGVSINHMQISGFGQALVLDHRLSEPQSIVDLFHSLHPDLSFVELVRLSTFEDQAHWFPMSAILKRYHFTLTGEDLEKWQALILALPIGFQDWCAEKKITSSELTPLASCDSDILRPLLRGVLNKNLSKLDGLLALELSIDLLLMGQTADSLTAGEDENGSAWVQRLRQLRYPEASSQDERAKSKLNSLPLPNSAQAKWVRHGDQAGIELKFFVSSPQDLAKQFGSLEKLQDLLEEHSEEFWTKH